MHASDVRRLTEAVGNRVLPIRPGDMLFFNVTNDRMFIVCVLEQEKNELSGGQLGQRIAGIRGGNGKYEWQSVWIAWEGYAKFWSIHRTS